MIRGHTELLQSSFCTLKLVREAVQSVIIILDSYTENGLYNNNNRLEVFFFLFFLLPTQKDFLNSNHF